MKAPQIAPRGMARQLLSAETVEVCRLLEQSGCRIVSAHAHGQIGVVVVDRRPSVPGLTPGCCRCDASGRAYRASVGAVAVRWTEPPRRTSPARPVAISPGERLAISLGHISPRAEVRA